MLFMKMRQRPRALLKSVTAYAAHELLYIGWQATVFPRPQAVAIDALNSRQRSVSLTALVPLCAGGLGCRANCAASGAKVGDAVPGAEAAESEGHACIEEATLGASWQGRR
jgi:hypothetical protein